MSIEQTKIFKKRIETPELRTNTLTSENLEGNNVLADTIWFAGHDLEDTLFGDNIEEIVIDPIEIISNANTGTISYGAEQIIAFQMKVTQDYKGKYMTSVTLRRCDTNTGGGKPVAQLEQVYLYANCMNSNDEVIDRFYSFDKHRQTQDDGLQTTWNFEEPIKISKDYEFIRFYCTREKGVPQTNVNLRSSNIKIGDTRQYINGWKTVDQSSTKNFTTDFCVNVYQRTTGLLDHVNDTTIHVTQTEKDKWNNHVGDSTHLTEAQKTAIGKVGTLETSINNHVGDDTHVTVTEKSQIAKVTNIQSNIEELETKYNNVITILNNSLPDIETFSTLDSGNYVVKSGGKTNATGVQLSREHFTTGSIKVVEICHIDGINANDIRLCVIVFNHGENENTPKSLDDCIFSVNTQTQTSGVGGSMCFRFNNLELPDDYEFVRFLFAKGDTVIPVYNNAETVIEARIQVLARNVDNGGFDESPDDECKVLHISSTSNWYPHVRVMKTVLGYSDIVSIINRVSQLEARVSELENS